jgi:UDP-sugar transporter A1/2/3
MLTFGCIIKQISYSKKSVNKIDKDESLNLSDFINMNLVLILIQVFSSCFAGVYNEYLLKEKDNNVDIMLQNFFMYFDSIVCNIMFLCLYIPNDGTSGGLIEAFSTESLKNVMNLKVMLIIINNAAIGIVTSLFLRFLNSILKAFASALELMFTGILSWLIFGIELDISTILSIIIVSLATWIYSKNPVQNLPSNYKNEDITSNEKV